MVRKKRVFNALFATSLLLAAVRGEEEEEFRATPVESAISVMLLGSIGFQMLLFYLVNWEDEDIKRYAWRVISGTISIFCAVLLFQGFNGMVEAYLTEGGSELWEIFVDMCQLIWWLTVMQTVLAVTSGAVNELWGGGEPSMESVQLNVKSYAILMSHVAGFSAINAWGSLQQTVFHSSPLMTLAIVPIGYVGLWGMYKGYARIRDHVSLGDDGEVDEYEALWHEETAESENDVAGLSLSFLTVQSLRFAIGGVLPNQEGVESAETEASHPGRQWQILMCCGMCFGCLGVLLIKVQSCVEQTPITKGDKEQEERKERLQRIVEILNNYFLFGNAWCFFYGVKWALSATKFTDEAALLHVVIALVLSAASFLMIFALDWVMDNGILGEGSETADAAGEKVIFGLSILVGFSWEQCFDTAVGVIAFSAKERCPPAFSKLVMSCILVIVVFPGWRRYILPKERSFEEETTEEGMKKSVLKAAANEHYNLMVATETDEHALDVAHLRMKQHRKNAHSKDSAQPKTRPDGKPLIHLQVTCAGIKEVDFSAEHHTKMRTTHQKKDAQPQSLLT